MLPWAGRRGHATALIACLACIPAGLKGQAPGVEDVSNVVYASLAHAKGAEEAVNHELSASSPKDLPIALTDSDHAPAASSRTHEQVEMERLQRLSETPAENLASKGEVCNQYTDPESAVFCHPGLTCMETSNMPFADGRCVEDPLQADQTMIPAGVVEGHYWVEPEAPATLGIAIGSQPAAPSKADAEAWRSCMFRCAANSTCKHWSYVPDKNCVQISEKGILKEVKCEWKKMDCPELHVVSGPHKFEESLGAAIPSIISGGTSSSDNMLRGQAAAMNDGVLSAHSFLIVSTLLGSVAMIAAVFALNDHDSDEFGSDSEGDE